MAKAEPHIPSRCRCGGSAKTEHKFRLLEARARMRCTMCDAHTAWAPTIWQAYADWERMVADDASVRKGLPEEDGGMQEDVRSMGGV